MFHSSPVLISVQPRWSKVFLLSYLLPAILPSFSSIPFHSLSFSFPSLSPPLLCFLWSWVYNSSLLQISVNLKKDIRTHFPHCFKYCNNNNLLNLYIAVVKSVYCYQRHQPISFAFPEWRWRTKTKGMANNDFWLVI